MSKITNPFKIEQESMLKELIELQKQNNNILTELLTNIQKRNQYGDMLLSTINSIDRKYFFEKIIAENIFYFGGTFSVPSALIASIDNPYVIVASPYYTSIFVTQIQIATLGINNKNEAENIGVRIKMGDTYFPNNGVNITAKTLISSFIRLFDQIGALTIHIHPPHLLKPNDAFQIEIFKNVAFANDVLYFASLQFMKA